MPLASFSEKRFPEEISYGSSGGPSFKTEIFETASGDEQRSSLWARARAVYNVAHGIKTREQFDELLAFFYEMRGRATGFRFKDWSDYTITAETLTGADGVKTAFQLTKTYALSGQTYVRLIYKPVAGSILGVTIDGDLQVENSDYTVNYATGVITFAVPPPAGLHPVVGEAQFDVPVRFDTDQVDGTHEFWETQSWPNIPLKEVRGGSLA